MGYLKSLCAITFSLLIFVACGNNADQKGMGMTDSLQTGQTIQPGAQMMMDEGKSVVGIASSTDSLSVFVQAVNAAGLADTLNSAGPYTIFIPTNEAFNALPEGKLDELMKPENKEKLASILKYHVVSGTIMTGNLQDGQTVPSIAGSDLEITTSDSTVMINGATILKTGMEASNGVIYVIDEVLMPSM